jgi:hypothetical protein
MNIENAVLDTLKRITVNIEELIGLALQVHTTTQAKSVDAEAEAKAKAEEEQKRQHIDSVWSDKQQMLAIQADYKAFYVSDESEPVEAFLVTGKLAGAQVANQVFRSQDDARGHLNSLDSGTMWATEIKKGRGTLWGRKPFAIYISRQRLEYIGYTIKPKKAKK